MKKSKVLDEFYKADIQDWNSVQCLKEANIMQKTFNLNGLRDDDGLEICFMHGYCHYLALGMADEYGSKVALWLDFDEEMEREVLVHAFSVIGDSLFFDADGVFTDLSERIDEFEYNYDPNIVIVSKDEAKKIFKKMKLPYGGTAVKRFIREELRGNSIVFQMRIKSDGIIRLFAYKGEGEMSGRKKVILSQVDSKGRMGEYLNSFSVDEFKTTQKMFFGVIPNERL